MKTVLITGGAGSLGTELTKLYLTKGYKVRVFSRDEYKHWKLKQELGSGQLKKVRFLIGDIRDKDRLTRACEGIDLVIHAGALKQIESGEYNPQEVVKTNVVGTSNVIDACIDNNVKRCAFISSDKAVNPSNLYGASKYMGEKLWIDANNIKGDRDMVFFAFRFGNLRGSAGSVWELFEKQKEKNTFTITDRYMTRFNYSLKEASEFIFRFCENPQPYIFVPKMKWFWIQHLPYLFSKHPKIKYIGLRKGEKLYEELCSDLELVKTYKDYYVIGKGTSGKNIRSGDIQKDLISQGLVKKSLYIS